METELRVAQALLQTYLSHSEQTLGGLLKRVLVEQERVAVH